MSIKPDWWINQQAMECGLIEPFILEHVNPASIDLTWSGRVKVAVGMKLDGTKIWADVTEHVTPDGFWFLPNLLYLMDSLEVVTIPNNITASLTLKSSMGRLGLEHLHSGFFDPGFQGTATWEIKVLSPWPILLKPCQRVMQLVFDEMASRPINDYSKTGRYNGQITPTEARL
jgi:deoxycytidine triphosphate deaminase